MNNVGIHNGEYPRPLSVRERDWIEWILPADRPGYKSYRGIISTMMVIGEGRRGKGEIILGPEGDVPDFDEPLSPVFSYGAIETNSGTISITLREVLHDQVSVEIVSHRSDNIPEEFEELRRWTYSLWSPGRVCPQCKHNVREVIMHTVVTGSSLYVLALCTADRRLWVNDQSSGINRLIPSTNFYNELMLHKNIRDPKIALDAKRLFTECSSYSDEDLTYAFLTYNNIKTKVHIDGRLEIHKKSPRRFSGKVLKLLHIHK